MNERFENWIYTREVSVFYCDAILDELMRNVKRGVRFHITFTQLSTYHYFNSEENWPHGDFNPFQMEVAPVLVRQIYASTEASLFWAARSIFTKSGPMIGSMGRGEVFALVYPELCDRAPVLRYLA